MDTDVVIIGGGIIGVSTAYILAKSGVSVHLIESGEISAGSSYGNAGLICPCHSKPVPAPGVLWRGVRWMLNPSSPFYIRPRLERELIAWLWEFRKFCTAEALDRAIPVLRDLQRASLALYRDWLNTTGIDADFEEGGGLELFLTKKRYVNGAKEVDHMRSFGINMSLLTRDEVLALEPAVTPDVVGGIHYREDAHINPALFVQQLANEAVRSGAKITKDTEITGFDLIKGNITAAKSNSNVFRGQEFVISAGAWTTQLASQLGIRLCMQAGKGYSITMPEPVNAPRIPLHLAEASMAVAPIGNLLRFAGTMELDGINTTINPIRVDAIRRSGYRYLATEEKLAELEIWSGMRPLPADGLPYIGRSAKVDNLVIATGHAMLGISMGPITGHLVAELISREKPVIDLYPFRIDRF